MDFDAFLYVRARKVSQVCDSGTLDRQNVSRDLKWASVVYNAHRHLQLKPFHVLRHVRHAKQAKKSQSPYWGSNSQL